MVVRSSTTGAARAASGSLSASGRSRPAGSLPPRDSAFPKRRRLLRRRDFLEVQRSGTGFRTRHFVVVVRMPVPTHGPRPDGTDLDPAGARLGIVASKRVGNAVARNRGKRLVREWFRRLGDAPAVDVVVILRAGAPELEAREAWSELDQGLREAHRRAARPRRDGRRKRRPSPSATSSSSGPDGGGSAPKR